MPLTKGQIVQIQVSKNWSRNYLQVNFFFKKRNLFFRFWYWYWYLFSKL